MKKLLFLITLMFTMVFVNAQDTVMYNNKTGAVVDEVTTRVEIAIATLADKLQQPAEHVYKVLIQQQFINSVVNTIMVVFAFVLGGILLTVTINSYKNYVKSFNSVYSSPSPDDGWWITGILISCALLIGGLIGFIILGSETFTGFFNPEYGAIKQFLNYL